MSNFIQGWYAIYTRPRHEKKIHSRLSELNVESFLPTIKEIRTWSDRKKFVEAPMFPSYVFIHLKSQQDYFKGLEADGALYYVKTSKTLARIQDEIINSLKLVVRNGTDMQVHDSPFRAGQKVLVQDGPLTGLAGEVIECEGKQRILIRVNLLQRYVTFSLPQEKLLIQLEVA